MVHLQPGALDAPVDVLGGGSLARDDVEVGFEPNPCMTYWLFDSGFAVYREFLRQDVQDLLTRQHFELAHVVDELLYVTAGDFIIGLRADQLTPMLEALDVLPRDAHIDHFDPDIGRFLRRFNSRLDGLNGVLDVGYNATGDPDGFTFAIADDLQLAMGIFLAYDASDFGGADVESDNDVLMGVGVFHTGVDAGGEVHLEATS